MSSATTEAPRKPSESNRTDGADQLALVGAGGRSSRRRCRRPRSRRGRRLPCRRQVRLRPSGARPSLSVIHLGGRRRRCRSSRARGHRWWQRARRPRRGSGRIESTRARRPSTPSMSASCVGDRRVDRGRVHCLPANASALRTSRSTSLTSSLKSPPNVARMLSASTNEPTTNDTPAVTVKAMATVRPIRALMLLRVQAALWIGSSCQLSACFM